MNYSKMIDAIDEFLERKSLDYVTPVEANAYLERKGILKDSHDRPAHVPLWHAREFLQTSVLPAVYQE